MMEFLLVCIDDQSEDNQRTCCDMEQSHKERKKESLKSCRQLPMKGDYYLSTSLSPSSLSPSSASSLFLCSSVTSLTLSPPSSLSKPVICTGCSRKNAVMCSHAYNSCLEVGTVLKSSGYQLSGLCKSISEKIVSEVGFKL